jgi:hypothetical protein
MHHFRRSWGLIAVWLAIASVLYRGLIPAGLMPASGEAARHGMLLVLCTHGELGGKLPNGGHAGDSSLQQCPFGAAAGPALPSTASVGWVAAAQATLHLPFSQQQPRYSAYRALPPARAPPALS